jgi:hypothetical protein
MPSACSPLALAPAVGRGVLQHNRWPLVEQFADATRLESRHSALSGSRGIHSLKLYQCFLKY